MSKFLNSKGYVIGDAMHTPDKKQFVQVCGIRGEVWVGLNELHADPTKTIRSISQETGARFLTPKTRHAFLEDVQNFEHFREGVVASDPGWAGNYFACGDGTVLTPPGDMNGVDVVAFNGLPKFRPNGDLADWHSVVGPFVSNQTLPYFVCALALVGPILRFLPAGNVNPQVELVGPAKNGKSTLGALAASVWAGDRERTEGGGESWNLTASRYGEIRAHHRDTVMVLDEAEGSGVSKPDRRSFAKMIIFAGATNSGRRRMGDPDQTAAVRHAVLSTTNVPLWEVLGDSESDDKGAVLSRMFSIRVSRLRSEGGLRIFDAKPECAKTIREAAARLRAAVNHAYATAGPAFARFLVEQLGLHGVMFERRVSDLFSCTTERLRRLGREHDERHLGMLASVEVAATLAQEAGVLPSEWGQPARIIEMVLGAVMSPATERSREQIAIWRSFQADVLALREAGHFQHLIPIPGRGDKGIYLLRDERLNQRKLLFLPPTFEAHFGKRPDIIRAARLLGRLDRHPSEPDRRTIRAPRNAGWLAGQRVHSFDVSDFVR